jgi:hypothetical protein|tara:strand:- start:1711 stop:2943 length:1233 start_codon:yes stop_codon:yes gene_type:complete
MPLKSGLAELQHQGKINNSSISDEVRNLQGKFFSVRVIQINQNGGGDNGTLQGTILDNIKFNGSEIVSKVLPLFPNVKNYPLVNEVVLVMALADKNYQQSYNLPALYYFNPINLWNTNQANPLPAPEADVTPQTQNKSYLEVESIGVPNKASKGSNTIFNVGNYFEEQNDINPTYPFEGDYIIDGRFGNSLRLGNTVPNGLTPIENNWSVTGSVGDPITIISNGHHKETPSYNSITEDINLDKSSAYFTSTQKIPIEVASTNDYLSYTDQTQPPTLPNQYTGEQIILNSGRLLFNTTKDHILLSSKKSINLNAVQSINLETIGPIILESSQVLLGSSLADESAILGDTLISTLQDLLTDMKFAIQTSAAQLGNNGIPLEPQGSAFRSLASSLDFTIQNLNNAKSQIIKVE